MKERRLAFGLAVLLALLVMVTRWGVAILDSEHYVPIASWDAGWHYWQASFASDNLRPPLFETDFDLDGAYPMNRLCYPPYLNQCTSSVAPTAALPAVIIGLLMRAGLDWSVATAVFTWCTELVLLLVLFKGLHRVGGMILASIAVLFVATSPALVWNLTETAHNILFGTLFLFILLDRMKNSTCGPVSTRAWILFPVLGLLCTLSFRSFVLIVPVILIPTGLFLRGNALKGALLACIGTIATPYLWMYPGDFLRMVQFRLQTPPPQVLRPGWDLQPSVAFITGFTEEFYHGVSLLQVGSTFLFIALIGVGLYWLAHEKAWHYLVPAMVSIMIFLYADLSWSGYPVFRYVALHAALASLAGAAGVHVLLTHSRGVSRLLIVAFMIGLLGVRADALMSRVSRDNETAMDMVFVETLDSVARSHSSPVFVLSRGGTYHTSFIGARLGVASYDFSPMYSELFVYDREAGRLSDLMLAVYYTKRPLPYVSVEQWEELLVSRDLESGDQIRVGWVSTRWLVEQIQAQAAIAK